MTKSASTKSRQMQPQAEEVLQVRIELILPVPDGCDGTAFHAGLRDQLLTSYGKEPRFEMSVQGLGTECLRLEGRVMFAKPCQVKNARERVKKILQRYHDGIGLPAVDPAFRAHLSDRRNLAFKTHFLHAPTLAPR